MYSVIDGALPAGVVLRPDGTFSGVPAEAGLFTVVVQVVDHRGGIDEVTLVVDVTDVLGEVVDRPPPDPDGTTPDPGAPVPKTGGEPGALVRLGVLLVVAGLLLRRPCRERRDRPRRPFRPFPASRTSERRTWGPSLRGRREPPGPAAGTGVNHKL